MFGSDILDIVIGMVFVFLLLSVVCSGINEFLEALVKNRARDLERGIRELIGDPENTTNFVEKIYNHGLVNSLFKGCYSPDKKRNLPSYIPSANFALAVIDLIQNPPAAGIKLPPNVQKAYDIFSRQAAGDAAKLQASLEDWFNTGMDRVSGWYKRRSQWILVSLGLIVAVALNADAVLIARTLSNDASLRQGLVAAAQARASHPLTAAAAASPASSPSTAQPAASPAAANPAAPVSTAPASTAPNPGPAAGQSSAPASAPASSPASGPAAAPAGTLTADSAQIQQDVAALSSIGLPIGWHRPPGKGAPLSSLPVTSLFTLAVHAAPRQVKRHLFGWLLTAIAVSMGAPFWFDLLGKIITVRSTLKPEPADS
jgi:hypothetical protein